MTDYDAHIEYPEWCDTEDKKEKYREWLDIQWTFWFIDRCLKSQEQLMNNTRKDNNSK